ncbi:putative PRS2 protein [Vibrio variabilis]|uniref:PRS2 protein n=1 Tax=Vibrio variabilis TaxID=990271 RepID=A0ABQ0JCT8_9VIBR|nr:putative PRS2 protein [Vibrio variabilis]
MLPVMFFYFRLSRSVFIQMLLFTLACLAVITFADRFGISILNLSIGLFVVLWIMQFVGHKIEGKKPSFFDDIQFLLIGPIWVFRQK